MLVIFRYFQTSKSERVGTVVVGQLHYFSHVFDVSKPENSADFAVIVRKNVKSTCVDETPPQVSS